MRLSAGCRRICKASNESAAPCAIASSPSSTNGSSGTSRNPATISGKYRASGLPLLARRSTSTPERNARQRKPSHFGSNCQPGSAGKLGDEMGFHRRERSGGARDLAFVCLGSRPHRRNVESGPRNMVRKRICSFGSSRKTPVKLRGQSSRPCLRMPRIDMHMCSASIITATPRGAEHVLDAPTICAVIVSCVCRRRAKMSTSAGELGEADHAVGPDSRRRAPCR